LIHRCWLSRLRLSRRRIKDRGSGSGLNNVVRPLETSRRGRRVRREDMRPVLNRNRPSGRLRPARIHARTARHATAGAMIARQTAAARLSMPATDGVSNRLSNPRHNATVAARPADHTIHKTRLLAMVARPGHTTDNRLNHIGDRLHQTGQNPRPTMATRPCHRIRHRLRHIGHRLQQTLASAGLPTGNRVGHRVQYPLPGAGLAAMTTMSASHRIRHRLRHISHRLQQTLANT
jgi:hypothetical protein